jgi:hypothetical protein
MPSTKEIRRAKYNNNIEHRNKRKQQSRESNKKRIQNETVEQKKIRLEKKRERHARGELSASQMLNRVPSGQVSGNSLFAIFWVLNIWCRHVNVILCQDAVDIIFKFAGPDSPKRFHWIKKGIEKDVEVMQGYFIGTSEGQAHAVWEIVKYPPKIVKRPGDCPNIIWKMMGMDGDIIYKQLQWVVDVKWDSRKKTQQEHADALTPIFESNTRRPNC